MGLIAARHILATSTGEIDAMAHLNIYVFHCSRCGEPAISLFKERTPGGTESQDAIFAPIDLKSIRTQCSACKHTQFRDASDAAHHELLDWN